MKKTFFLLFIFNLLWAAPLPASAVPLNDAVGAGDLPKARQLIEAGADVNAKDEASYTPLHRAADVGSLELAQLLLDHHADVGAVDKDGNTALHIAAAKGRRKTIELLVKQGAKTEAANNDGDTPLHLAVQEGRLGTIEDLLNAGAAVDGADNQGNTPLHIAAAKGQRKAVDLLLKHEAAIDAHNQGNRTPLDVALQEGRTSTVEALLDAGAHTGSWDPDIGDENNGPEDLLSAAIASGKRDMIGFLLKKGALVLPQHVYADAGGCVPAPQFTQMISKPRAAGDTINISGAVLATVAFCGDMQLLAALKRNSRTIDYAGAAQSWATVAAPGKPANAGLFNILFAGDPDLKAHATMMFDSCARGLLYSDASGQQVADDGFLTFLLSKGADTNTKDEYGNTLLHLAAGGGNMTLVKFLLAHGANANAATEWGNTPLFRAILAGRIDVVKYLLEHGANVNAANELGNTPLHFAAARNQKDISALLIKKGAEVNADNEVGNTPLHQAVRFPESFDTVTLLLKNGADVKAGNGEGMTALHFAANRNHPSGEEDGGLSCSYVGNRPCEGTPKDDDLVKLVKELVKHKADVLAADEKGRTAIDLAATNTAHPAVARYLETQTKKHAK